MTYVAAMKHWVPHDHVLLAQDTCGCLSGRSVER
jgi:hypothetical protein